jgi:hypothetical protein
MVLELLLCCIFDMVVVTMPFDSGSNTKLRILISMYFLFLGIDENCCGCMCCVRPEVQQMKSMKGKLYSLTQSYVDASKGKTLRGIRLTFLAIFLMIPYVGPEDDMPWEEHHVIKRTNTNNCFVKATIDLLSRVFYYVIQMMN